MKIPEYPIQGGADIETAMVDIIATEACLVHEADPSSNPSLLRHQEEREEDEGEEREDRVEREGEERVLGGGDGGWYAVMCRGNRVSKSVFGVMVVLLLICPLILPPLPPPPWPLLLLPLFIAAWLVVVAFCPSISQLLSSEVDR